MFSSSQKHVEPGSVVELSRPPLSSPSAGATVIARGVKVEGDFASQGDVVIEGEVHGKITTGGTLTVGPEAVIKADLVADEALISGRIEGNVTVKKQLVLHATAHVRGDITVERAMVEAGAVVEGNVHIGSGHKEAAAKPGQKASAASSSGTA
ncbi:MAG: hypothetical protein RL141_525 [Candidatus Parcubacteria bacterium]|jgi:cytoskeletal protein CcmA (bactofilin family)